MRREGKRGKEAMEKGERLRWKRAKENLVTGGLSVTYTCS